jgi:hypothetical protein
MDGFWGKKNKIASALGIQAYYRVGRILVVYLVSIKFTAMEVDTVYTSVIPASLETETGRSWVWGKPGVKLGRPQQKGWGGGLSGRVVANVRQWVQSSVLKINE